nr:integrase, catalytic region, zinc finger, CCHC-type, peptidase aspartic, catalytic [Tanacetum cinerariifolium]
KTFNVSVLIPDHLCLIGLTLHPGNNVFDCIVEELKEPPHLGPERPQVYSDLSPEEKDRVVVQNVQGRLNRSQGKNLRGGGAARAQTMFIANLSSANPVYDQVGPSYDSDILSEVHDHDHYHDAVYEHHEEHKMHDSVQLNHVVDSHVDYMSDSNMIPYDQCVKDNAVPGNTVVDNLLTAELATYKEQVELPKPYYNELNKVVIGYKNPLCLTRAKQVQPALYNGHEIIKDNLVSAIMHNTKDTLEIAEITRRKMNDKMKDPECVNHKARCLELEAELSNLRDKSHNDNHNELVNQFSNLEHYKELYGSIKITRAKHIEHVMALTTKNVNLKAQILNNVNSVSKDHVKPTVLAPGKYAIDVEPFPSRLRNNREAHLDYLRHLKESVKTIREIVEEAKVVRPLDSSSVSACRYTKHSQELLEYAIVTCLQDSHQRDKKHAPTPLIRKNQVTFSEQCDTSNSNTHKHVTKLNTQKTNVPVPPSTGVNRCIDASGSQPMSNTKKNKISPAKGVNKMKVEEHHRTNKSHLRTSNRIDSSSRSKSTDTPSIYNICNVVRKVKQVLKPKQVRQVWKPTGKVAQIVLWYLDSCCSKHMTGDRSRLMNFMKKFIEIVRFRNDHFVAIMGYGDYVISDSVIFRKHSCYVRDTDGVKLIKGSRGSNLYTISVEDMIKSFPICLLSKASKNKSWLWHRRLNRLNFGTINDLTRKDLVRGPTPIFLTPGQISSGLAPNSVLAAPYVPLINKDLEILFQLMFDEYLEPPRVKRPVSPASAVQVPVNSVGAPSSTTIDQDAPSLSYGITDTWDEIVDTSMVIAPTTLEGVNQIVTELDTTVWQRTHEDRPDHRRTAMILDREAMYAREVWAVSEDRSAAIAAHLRTLKAQVAALIAQTSSLQTQLTTSLGHIEILEASDLEPQEGPAEASSSCVAAALAERDTDISRNGDNINDSGTSERRKVTTQRECTYTDFLKCQPMSFQGTKRVVKFASLTLQGSALTWWNSHLRAVGQDVAYAMP